MGLPEVSVRRYNGRAAGTDDAGILLAESDVDGEGSAASHKKGISPMAPFS